MATTNTINLKVGYEDYTERTYKIPYVGTSTMNYDAVVTKIKEFNTAASTQDSNVKQTFLSENGAQITGITDATIVRREETEIYHA